MRSFEVIFAHLIEGYCPLWRTRGVLIPSPFVKTTLEPFILKVHRPHVPVFPTFSLNKRWWWLRAPSSLGRRTREPRFVLPYRDLDELVQLCIRVEKQLKRKSSSKNCSSYSYTKKDQAPSVLGVTPSKPKDDKGKNIEEITPKASSQDITSNIKCFKCIEKGVGFPLQLLFGPFSFMQICSREIWFAGKRTGLSSI